jgi:antitoxin CcdA
MSANGIAFNADAPKRRTEVSLNRDLLDQAQALSLDVSGACERGLMIEIAEAKSKAWAEENAEAIAAANAYVEKNGLPLARFRRF